MKRTAIFGSSGGLGGALTRLLADKGVEVLAGSRSGNVPDGQHIQPFRFDLEDEASLAEAVAGWQTNPPDSVIVTTGVLTLDNGTGPERSYKRIEPDAMERLFRLNTIGPALIAKHVLPLLPRDRRTVFAAISARVGSIGDNRIGGWHSYRASKAALNMLLRNFAIEMARTHKQAIIAGLHPGTVDTGLSRPFQANLPEGQLFTPARSASCLIEVMDNLTPQDSGKVFDWRGDEILP